MKLKNILLMVDDDEVINLIVKGFVGKNWRGMASSCPSEYLSYYVSNIFVVPYICDINIIIEGRKHGKEKAGQKIEKAF